MNNIKKYKGLLIGEFSKEKENFWFTYNGRTAKLIFIRHSENAIKNLVKDLGMSWAIIYRDKGYWTVCQQFTQTWDYNPKYK